MTSYEYSEVFTEIFKRRTHTFAVCSLINLKKYKAQYFLQESSKEMIAYYTCVIYISLVAIVNQILICYCHSQIS
jgi:hypothetical protein